MHSYKKIHIILLFTILMFLFTSRTIIFAQNSQGQSLGDQSQVDPSDPTSVTEDTGNPGDPTSTNETPGNPNIPEVS